MYITLKDYLQKMESLERTRPAELRREVPSIVSLAEAVGIHPVTLSNIANNNIIRLNLKTSAVIIDEMRRRGFPMDASDFVSYRPSEGGSHE